MNSLIKNKRRALRAAVIKGHKFDYSTRDNKYNIFRCLICGMMLYVTGKHYHRTYGKTVSGDASTLSCDPDYYKSLYNLERK